MVWPDTAAAVVGKSHEALLLLTDGGPPRPPVLVGAHCRQGAGGSTVARRKDGVGVQPRLIVAPERCDA